jgi:hypothetical protein
MNVTIVWLHVSPGDYLPCNFEELQNLVGCIQPGIADAVTFVTASRLFDAIDQCPV